MHKFSVLHVEDAAAAYSAAMQHGTQRGIYNITGQQGISHQELAKAISEKLSTKELSYPLEGLSLEEAGKLYGSSLAQRFAMNAEVSSAKARKAFHWNPEQTSGFLQTIAESERQ